MPRIVDADPDRPDRNDRNITVNERITQGNPIAEIVKAIPWFIWATPGWILCGLILLAIGHYGFNGFVNGLFSWLSLLPWVIGVFSIIKGVLWAHNTFDMVMTRYHNRHLLASNARKVDQSVLALEKKNRLLDAELAIALQIAGSIDKLIDNGTAFKYSKMTLDVLGRPGQQTLISQVQGQQQLGAGPAPLALGPGGMVNGLPTQVLYEEVKGQVPQGHVLVGIGRAGLDTIEQGVGAMVWICGLSGTGKTSTTVLRVDERREVGHKFLGVDPHFFKKDSLTNAVKAYAESFIMPMAHTPEEMKEVLQRFLNEFYGRKGGRIPMPWQRITLLVDEVGSLMDATDDLEKEIAAMLKRIARICGQESRDFNMGGIFISQQATQLAWLRKVALMVFVHQLIMESEKDLACNGDREVMKDMEKWPRGRTYVYGVGFGAGGARIVQQPYFGGPGAIVPADGDPALTSGNDAGVVDEEPLEENSNPGEGGQEEQTTSNVIPALTGDLRTVYEACQQLQAANERISTRAIERLTKIDKDKANGLLHRLAAMGYIPPRTNNKAV